MTLILTVTDQDTLLRWAAAKIGLAADVWDSPRDEAMAVVDADTGRIRAVMVVDGNQFGGAPLLHFATDGSRSWATRNILGGLFGYLFFFRRFDRVLTITPQTRRDAVLLNVRLGWQIDGVMNAAPAAPDVIFSMNRVGCAWINPEPEGGDDGQG